MAIDSSQAGVMCSQRDTRDCLVIRSSRDYGMNSTFVVWTWWWGDGRTYPRECYGYFKF